MIEEYTEAKPEQIIKLDSKTEISIIKPKKELKESSTQKEIEENKINKLNQISFLFQNPILIKSFSIPYFSIFIFSIKF